MPPRHPGARRSTQPTERDAFLDALEFAPGFRVRRWPFQGRATHGRKPIV
jgi:hypothetical protein